MQKNSKQTYTGTMYTRVLHLRKYGKFMAVSSFIYFVHFETKIIKLLFNEMLFYLNICNVEHETYVNNRFTFI